MKTFVIFTALIAYFTAAFAGVIQIKREAQPQFIGGSGSQASAHSSSGSFNLGPFGGISGSSADASAGSHSGFLGKRDIHYLVKREASPQFIGGSGSQASAHSSSGSFNLGPFGGISGSNAGASAGSHSGFLGKRDIHYYLVKREAQPQFVGGSGSQASAHSSSGSFNLGPFGGLSGSSAQASAGSHSGFLGKRDIHYVMRREASPQFFGGSGSKAHSHSSSGTIGLGPFHLSGSSSHASSGSHSGFLG